MSLNITSSILDKKEKQFTNANCKPLPWLGNQLMVMSFTEHVYEHDRLACDKTLYLATYTYWGIFINYKVIKVIP